MPDGEIVGAAGVHGLLTAWRRLLQGDGDDGRPAASVETPAGDAGLAGEPR